jgi:hypothetical protein
MEICLQELDKWRDSVIAKWKAWQERMKEWRKVEARYPERLRKWEDNERKAAEIPARHTLSSYFTYDK